MFYRVPFLKTNHNRRTGFQFVLRSAAVVMVDNPVAYYQGRQAAESQMIRKYFEVMDKVMDSQLWLSTQLGNRSYEHCQN